ncbi:unnamed protein product [Anisakis simplex]|uniref:Uncharacterized protein n=1 Tax=Anisakis simplex TaxID=6269 RepID=A0A0M3JWV6_ANISI|nr:unnamed protein product [Anisakis simplex]
MIFFVWSLVLSAVHYARKQRLIKILSGYFFSPRHHDTMLLCRHIINFNLRTKFLERGGNALGVGGPRASLCRFSSEPTIAHINECSLLYRNDEVEILVRPRSKQAFQIDDWFIISKPLLSRTPRITFVVTLGPVCLLSPPKGTATGTISADELRQEDDIGSSSTIRNQENDRLTPDETFRSYSQLEALHFPFTSEQQKLQLFAYFVNNGSLA